MTEANEQLLTVAEVARSLRVGERTVLRWIHSGTLEVIRLPSQGKRSRYRVSRSTLDRLLASPSSLSAPESHPLSLPD